MAKADVLKNVKTVVYNSQTDEFKGFLIAQVMTRGELLDMEIRSPGVNVWEECYLEYYVGTEVVRIDLENKTSDVPAEWIPALSTKDYIVQQSIIDDVDYVFDYFNEFLKCVTANTPEAQREYIENRR